MKIVIATGIYPPESGGPATYSQSLAEALRARGHEVTIVAYGDGYPAEREVERVSRRGGPVIRYLRFAWEVFKTARRADLVYAQGPVSEGLPATLGAWIARRPVVMKVVGDYAWEMHRQKNASPVSSRNGSCQGSRLFTRKYSRDKVFAPSPVPEAQSPVPELLDQFLEFRHKGGVGWYERIERWTARRAKRIIVPSKYLATVVARWEVSASRIEVIPNSIEPLPETQGRDIERRTLGVENKIVVLTAVRAVPWKGISELISWWPKLPESHVLVVVGDGPELESWKHHAISCGVASRVIFTGRLSRVELARWYDAADAFALNSGYEGYPHVIAEAVSVSLPCILSDAGGNPEVKDVIHQETLFKFLPYNNRDAWIVALRAVQKRADSRQETMEWTHEKMVAATEKILKCEDERLCVVMVSYDRGLLDPSSEVYRRVSSIADDTSTIKMIVMQGRIFKNVLTGIRYVRQLPGRTIVTAQDPFAAGLVGYLISRWTNTPLEIQEHGDFFSGEWVKESWKNRILSFVGRFILKRAERVRTVSERVKEHLIAIGVSESRIEVIPVSLDLWRMLELPFQALASVPHIVVPCRFVEQKGLDTLIKAASILSASILSKNKIQFRLSIIGSGPLDVRLRSRIEASGLSGIVALEPWQNDSVSLWGANGLFVMSSRYEGWGRTIVEAMASGVPIVTTDVGCVGSFFRPQIDGRVVQPNDPEALAQAIEEQITETERREAMRRSARERAASFPSREELHAKQREGWGGVLSAGRRAPGAENRTPDPRFELWVGAFLAFAIGSRILSVALFHDSLLNREWGFFNLIENWMNGYGYSFAAEPGCASAYRSPGYLFFLSGLYSLFSPNNTLAQAIIQNLFVVGVLWLVYAVGEKLVGKRGALIGAFLMAAYPYTFYHYTQYYHTFLSSFFLLLLVWFLLRLAESRHWFHAVGAGLSIGCLAYVQGTILPATPLIVAWLVYRFWPDWRMTLKFAVIMAVFSAGLIAPWTYRNWKQLHAFVPLTTDLGHALFKANNEIIYELTKRGYPQEIVDEVVVSSTNSNYKQYRMPAYLEDEFKHNGVFRDSVYWTAWHPQEPNSKVATCAALGPMNEVEFNRYWTARAKEWIGRNWWTEGWKLQLFKLKTFWQPSLFPSVKTGVPWSFADSPIKVRLARNTMTAASALVIFGGLLGLGLSLRRRDKNAWLALAILLVFSVMHTFFAGYTKYRIPLDNLLAVYAGLALVAIIDAVRGRSRKKE